MIRTLLSDPLLVPHARTLARSYGIKKDRYGYPITKRDPETEEPKETLPITFRAAPPPPERRAARARGSDVQDRGAVLLYKQFLEDDQRNVRQMFENTDNRVFKDSVSQVPFEQGMKRTGLIARKHGESRAFLRTGEVVITTYLEIPDNYVMGSSPVIYKGSTDYRKLKLAAFDAPDVQDVPLVKQKEYLSIGMYPKEAENEFIVTPENVLPANYKLDISHFFCGQFLDVAGLTINRGFQGVIRRWGYAGQGAGRTKTHRRPGSISTQGLARVLKGKKLAGVMGNRKHVTRDARILYVNYQDRYLTVAGALQGINGCFLYVSDSERMEPIQAPLLHFPTFLGDRTEVEREIYDKTVVDPRESFEEALSSRVDLQLV